MESRGGRFVSLIKLYSNHSDGNQVSVPEFFTVLCNLFLFRLPFRRRGVA